MKNTVNIIGHRKYEALKALDLDNLTDDNLTAFNLQFKNLTVGEALKMIDVYEQKFKCNDKNTVKLVSDYFEKLSKGSKLKKSKVLTKQILWDLFIRNYAKNNGKLFSKTPDSIENIKPLIYYFIGDFESFKACKNVSDLSIPSLEKGLLIIGNYGNGKTTVMRALETSLKHSNVRFKTYTTNEIVTMFESCKEPFEREEFHKQMQRGTINFDDVLTERVASNYGKSDLMKDILETRYDKNKRTYLTLNYSDEHPEDLKIGLEQLGIRYGSRVYDRLFSMFNIIEFKGKTFRK